MARRLAGDGDAYEDVIAGFRWAVPERFNIAVACCDRHADGRDRLALTVLGPDGAVDRWSFDRLKAASNRLANALAAHDIKRGDRVGILLSQSVECALAHLAVYKLGAIALPLFALFGPEALAYRLSDSGAKGLITDRAGWAKVAGLDNQLPGLRSVLVTDATPGQAPTGTRAFWPTLERGSDAFDPVQTLAEDPALIIYTSGTTGQPKGALHAHRVLLGHLPGVEVPQNRFHDHPDRAPGDHFWTPADWAWIGGLLDVLLPAWFHAYPVLAEAKAKFDPDRAADLIEAHRVRHAFLPPTALKLMRQTGVRPIGGLRAVASGGETLGAELLDWGREVFALTINEFYGQTECNVIVGNGAGLFDPRPGSMGRPIPGHRVAIVDAEGAELPAGAIGQIAVHRPDPVMFLGYWNKPEATLEKFVGPQGERGGDWLVTGDTGRRDEDGYLWFVGRDDDVITSAGYRIGPGEIEDCLIGHEAVAMAAAVGVPDAVRTEIVKAVVVLRPGFEPSDALAEAIKTHVKDRLAAHEYPRIVEFRDALPMTTTGKIIRRALRD